MKTLLALRLIAASLFAPALFLFAAQPTIPSMPAVSSDPTQPPAVALVGELKNARYENRAEVSAKLAAEEARFSLKLKEWENKKTALAMTDKAPAETELKQMAAMSEVLRQKVDEVQAADEITWPTAKDAVVLALQNLIAIYRKLDARFTT